MFVDSPAAAYAATQTHGQVTALPGIYATARYGVVAPKGSTLFQAIQGALTKLMADGVYQRILSRWQMTAGTIGSSQVDPAVTGAR